MHNNSINDIKDNLSQLSDEELILMGKSFDKDVMSHIISRYTCLVTAISRRLTKGRQDYFDDMVSEGFLGLINAVKTFSPQKGTFRTYAATCISNKIKTALKKTASADSDYSQTYDIPAGDFSPEELLLFKERSGEIKKAMINLLSTREFSVLMLYTASYSYADISKELQLDEKAVDNALQRARKKLKKYFSS